MRNSFFVSFQSQRFMRASLLALCGLIFATAGWAQDEEAQSADASVAADSSESTAAGGDDSDVKSNVDAAADEAGAPDTSGEADEEEQEAAAAVNPLLGPGGGTGEPAFPLHAFISVTNTVGQGTFIVDGFANPMFASSLSLTPYIAWEGWWFMANQSFNFEWTQSDTTTLPNQLMVNDTIFQARYWGIAINELSLRLPVTFRVSLPTSLASRWSGRAAGLGLTSAFQWNTPFNVMFTGNVTAGYNVIVPSWAQRGATDDGKAYQDRFLGTLTPKSCLIRSPVEAANFACGNIPRVASVSGSLGFNWFAAPGVMVSGRMGMNTGLSYFWSPDDEFTSDNARPGLGHGESTNGSLSVSYSPLPWLWLTVGADTAQGLYQANGRDIRWFPFWDFWSPANNLSTVSFDTTFIL